MQHEKDITASGVGINAENRMDIARVMGPEVIPQRSELQRTMTMMQSAAALGRPDLIPQQSLGRAALLDSLTADRQMSKSQATKLLEYIGQ